MHGGRNVHNQHMTWWNCHNGQNQAWFVDTKGINYPTYPLKNGVFFQIKSRMAGHKALFWHEHIGGHQYRLRIRENNPVDIKQWWKFDTRTKTIRSKHNAKNAISNQAGQAFNRGKAAVIRAWKGQANQKTQWHGGKIRNIRNNGNLCLDVWGGKNVHNQHLTWWTCHNGAN